jgi:hypothetical protein
MIKKEKSNFWNYPDRRLSGQDREDVGLQSGILALAGRSSLREKADLDTFEAV